MSASSFMLRHRYGQHRSSFGEVPSDRALEAAKAFAEEAQKRGAELYAINRSISLGYTENGHLPENEWTVFLAGISPMGTIDDLKLSARHSVAADVNVRLVTMPHRGEYGFTFSLRR